MAGLILATVVIGMTGYTVYLANQFDSLLVQEKSLQASVEDNEVRISQGTNALVELRAQRDGLNGEVREITAKRDAFKIDLDTVLEFERREISANRAAEEALAKTEGAERQFEELTNEIFSAKTEKLNLDIDIAQLNSQLNRAKDQTGDQQAELVKLDDELTGSRKLRDDLLEQRDQLWREVARLQEQKAEKTALETRAAELLGEIEQDTIRKNQLDRELASLKDKRAQALDDADGAKAKLWQEKAQLEAIQKSADEEQTRVDVLVARKAVLEQQVASLDLQSAEVVKTDIQLSELAARKTTLASEVLDLEKTKAKLAGVNQTTETARQELEALRTKTEFVRLQKKDDEQLLLTARSDLTVIQSQLDSLKPTLAKKQAALATIRADLTTFETDLRSVRDQLILDQKVIADKQSRIAILEAKAQGLELRKQALGNEVEKLKSQQSAAQNVVTDLAGQRGEVEANLVYLTAQLNKLEKDLKPKVKLSNRLNILDERLNVLETMITVVPTLEPAGDSQ